MVWLISMPCEVDFLNYFPVLKFGADCVCLFLLQFIIIHVQGILTYTPRLLSVGLQGTWPSCKIQICPHSTAGYRSYFHINVLSQSKLSVENCNLVLYAKSPSRWKCFFFSNTKFLTRWKYFSFSKHLSFKPLDLQDPLDPWAHVVRCTMRSHLYHQMFSLGKSFILTVLRNYVDMLRD